MNINTWRRKLEEAMRYGTGDFDPDHPPCPECGAEMTFYGHDDNGDYADGEGYWECSSCGFRFTEDEL